MRFAALLILAIFPAAFAQPPAGKKPVKPAAPPPFTSSPSIEDRYLYYAFFNTQHGILAANNAAKSANPASAAAIDQQAAATLHVTAPDIPIIDTLLQKASNDYAQVPALHQSRVTAAKVKLTPAQEAGLNDQLQLEATARAIFALSKQLPTSSWVGLHSYITVEFKKTYKDPRVK